jgi:hypothetical protein
MAENEKGDSFMGTRTGREISREIRSDLGRKRSESDHAIVEQALNTALAEIQQALGVTDGGFASQHFGGGPLQSWDSLVMRLVQYMEAERMDAGCDDDRCDGEGYYCAKHLIDGGAR